MKDIIVWIAGQTGLTEQIVSLIGSFIILPVLAVITKKLDWSKFERATYVFFYGVSQKANDFIVKIPYLGFVWEKWFENYFLKVVAGLFRVIGQIPLAIAAGFNSRNESLVGDK